MAAMETEPSAADLAEAKPEDEDEGESTGVAGTPAFKRCLEAVRLDDSCYASWSLLIAEAEATDWPPPCWATTASRRASSAAISSLLTKGLPARSSREA